jgi:uncharacterized protein YbjT (DUF2867 family)
MCAITGITGKVGGALARTLLAERLPVRAVLREEVKAAKSASGTFRKCDLRRVKAALGSTADSSKPPEGAFMSSRPN